jgi:D-3-phosphoglycerate dehydrogenase / 2-oxoglutarate reductase
MSARDQVVYIDAAGDSAAVERAVLAARGYELVLADCSTDDEVVEVAGEAPAILNGMYRLGANLFQRLPTLRVVVRGGVGYDNIDIDAATRAGVVACNVIDYCTDEVANHAFAMLLALNRKIVPLDRAVRAGSRGPAPEMMPHTGRVAGQTLGLVSLGAIARAVAKRAAGFDMRVIAFDPYVDPVEGEGLGVELVSLPELLSQSDYVSIHTPLGAGTRGLIGARELALMKSSAYLIMTSRGGVVEESALANALGDGRIAGAGIDVWESEPPDPDHPLLKFDSVVACGHMAWYSEVADIRRRRAHAETAADVLDGIIPRSVVNPEVLEYVSLQRSISGHAQAQVSDSRARQA